MACMKLGSKADAFQRKGRAWFCTTGLPSDITVEVGDMSFHLHKFPLLSRSGVLERLIAEASSKGEDICLIKLPYIPGNAKIFEIIAKFCYGVKLELTSSNVVHIRCASEHLEMTEDYGEANLISQTEFFLNQVVICNWKDSLKALQSCEEIFQQAEELNIIKRCLDSLAAKVGADPNLFGWPVKEHTAGILWNGISSDARPKNADSDWWYEDASTLSWTLYKRLISTIGCSGIEQEILAGSLAHYAKRYIPGLSRRQGVTTTAEPIAQEEQKVLIEEIDRLLPMTTGLVSTKFLCSLLRTAVILRSNQICIANLERRVGLQLDQATLEDLLMPSFSYTMETLYNVDAVERVLDHFLAMDQPGASPCSFDDGQLMSLTPITMVSKLIDGYLAEIAPDVNLSLAKFLSLAAAVPDYARPLDDGLYRAIDIYLKSHPSLVESDREQLCRLMDCQKLSLEACTHAAQNERLPLRVIVQVLFFEQLQLRTSIASCLLVSDNLDPSMHLRGGGVVMGGGGGSSAEGGGVGWANTATTRENQVLKVGMDSMRMRVAELEKECSNMRDEIAKLGRNSKGSSSGGAWGSVTKKFGFKMKSQMCSAEDGSVHTKAGAKTTTNEGKRNKSDKSVS
ncbi:BTB/POZ domain-containing protein At1g30440-like [Impatiens glandulifera]|uniref:BTB/POZ domain-containing protein At1g30440-like n=1 Tax=Impatiens glandulifera TaxID=253017 RepID=UPI001FB15576|nr:BTB/POZ domain-containing protein At1g30440-like [Impatiens glandulifera]XP_047327208.1 BTB/POZ domain-containing protein At1g30440-like [Impatiens glandulifera]